MIGQCLHPAVRLSKLPFPVPVLLPWFKVEFIHLYFSLSQFTVVLLQIHGSFSFTNYWNPQGSVGIGMSVKMLLNSVYHAYCLFEFWIYQRSCLASAVIRLKSPASSRGQDNVLHDLYWCLGSKTICLFGKWACTPSLKFSGGLRVDKSFFPDLFINL